MMKIDKYFLFFLIPFVLSLIYQIKIFKTSKPKSCLDAFKLNNLSGAMLLLFILSFNIS